MATRRKTTTSTGNAPDPNAPMKAVTQADLRKLAQKQASLQYGVSMASMKRGKHPVVGGRKAPRKGKK